MRVCVLDSTGKSSKFSNFDVQIAKNPRNRQDSSFPFKSTVNYEAFFTICIHRLRSWAFCFHFLPSMFFMSSSTLSFHLIAVADKEKGGKHTKPSTDSKVVEHRANYPGLKKSIRNKSPRCWNFLMKKSIIISIEYLKQ